MYPWRKSSSCSAPDSSQSAVAAREHRRVVRRRPLRILREPVPGLGVHHFLVVRRKQADRRRPADAPGEHRLRHVHVDVVDLDRPQRSPGRPVQDLADTLQGLAQREMTRRLAARRPQRRTPRPDRGKIELDHPALVERGDKRVEAVRPTLNRVRHAVMLDRQVVLGPPRRQRRQQDHVLLLHREAHPAAAEQQEKILPEEFHPVHVREAAVEHPAVVAEDCLPAELHRAHAGQHLLRRHLRKGGVDQLPERPPRPRAGEQSRLRPRQLRDVRRQFRRHAALPLRREEPVVHVAHPLDAFGEELPPAQLRPVARVLRHRDVVRHAVVRVRRKPPLRAPRPVQHVGPRHLPVARRRDRLLHRILHLLDRGMPAVPVMQLQHLRHRRRDPRHLAVGRVFQAVARQRVVAAGIWRAVRAHLVERQRDRPRNLARVEAHPRPVPLHHQAALGRNRAIQQLNALPDGRLAIRQCDG